MFAFTNKDRESTLGTRVRLAGTSRERRRGLLGNAGFDDISGLWIVPCEAVHTFGMKMPIDSIFLDRRLRVKSLRTNLKPSRVAICLSAHSVLELPAGTVTTSGTTVGDQLATSKAGT